MTQGDADRVIQSIRRSLRQLLVATLVLGFIVVGFAVYAVSVAETLKEATCTLRSDLKQRVDDSREFLRDHPNGIEGIPASVIEQGIRTQQATVDALADLDCE